MWAESHLQLVVVSFAAAVCLFGRVFVGVEQEADAAVITHLHVFNTWNRDTAQLVNLVRPGFLWWTRCL